MEESSHQVLRQAAETAISTNELAAAIAEDIHREEQRRYGEALYRLAGNATTASDRTGGTMSDPQTARTPDNVALGVGAFTARPFGPLQSALDQLVEEHARRAGAQRLWDPPTPTQTNQETDAATRRSLEEILRTHRLFRNPADHINIAAGPDEILRHKHVPGMDFDGDSLSLSFEQWMEQDKREREKALDDLVTECEEWSKGGRVSGNSLDVIELPEFKAFREFLSEAIIAFCTEKRNRVFNYPSPSGRYGDYELSLFMEKNEVVAEPNTVDITNMCLKIFDKGLIDRIRILTYMMGRSTNSAGVWLFGLKLGVVLRTAEVFSSIIYDSSKCKECACLNIKGLMLSGSILCVTAGTKYEAVLYRALMTILEKARKLYVQAQVMDLAMRELFEGRQSLVDRELIQRNNEIPEPKDDSFIKQELENFKLED